MFGWPVPPKPPPKDKFICPHCKKPRDKLLSSASHDWICYECAGDLEEKGETPDFSEPTPRPYVHDYYPPNKYSRLP